MIGVRKATLDDLPALVALGRLMHAEAPELCHASYSAEKVSRVLKMAIEAGGVFVHINAAQEIDGGFAGMIVERWFSTDKIATDIALFVRPDRRGGLVAVHLIDAFIEWCERQGIAARDVVIGVSTGVNADATGRLYERVGFERIGGIYRLRGY